jgi:rubrerythrin
MNVFEFAMQMEKDGEAYYRKMAANAENGVIKNILTDLAEDEVKHYKIFRKFRDGDLSGAKLMKDQTQVMKGAKNVFQKLAASKKPPIFSGEVVKAWKEAQNIEKKSEDFYRDKAGTETTPEIRKTLNLIADEEHKHWALIENIVHFLERPKQWLEDAEWNNLDNY